MARRRSRRDPWGRDQPRRPGPLPYPADGYYYPERVTAGRVAWAAARGYGRWVARAPDTRGLASGLVVLYPAAEIAHLTHADPVLVASLAAPLAVAAWVGTFKAHHSKKYSATVTATVAAVPAWVAYAAAFGVFNVPTLVGYTTTAALAWAGYTWSDVLRDRRSWKTKQVEWETIAAAAGLAGSVLIGLEDTRLGQDFRVDIRGTGKTARQLAGSDLHERIAAMVSLPAERVRVITDPRHAGIIVVKIQLRDPWTDPVTHPALSGQVSAAPRRRRSIMDGPLSLGLDPDTGHSLELVIINKAGGRHTQIFATTGGGKTTLLNNIMEQGTDRRDVLPWAIDLGKGTIPGIWADALDAGAGVGQEHRALQILHWGCTVIAARSTKTHGRNHKPTPAQPIILLIIDELDTLTGFDSPIAHKAKPLVDRIYRRGRSAGVHLVTAGQRGVVQHTGSKEGKANAANKIVLRMLDTIEMNHAAPGWQTTKMPDMSTYAPGIEGVALVVVPGGTWRAGRVTDMSDLDAVEQLAQQRGRPTSTLEPDIAALLPGYHQRHLRPAPVGAPGGPVAGRIIPLHPSNNDDNDGPGGRGGAWGVDPSDRSAVDRLAHDLVAEVEARLAGMPTPPDQPTLLADLIAAKHTLDHAEHNPPDVNRAITVPDRIADPILALLDQRGHAGARRDELVAAVGRSRSAVASWLAIMRDHGLIASVGATKAARYYLPEHAPDADDPDADGDR